MNETKKCKVDGCDGKYSGKGYCLKHYANWKRTGDPIPRVKPHRTDCSVEGCLEPHRRNGLCSMHSTRMRRRGHTNPIKEGAQPIYANAEERKAALKASQKIYNQTPKGKATNVLKRHRRRHLEVTDVELTAKEVMKIHEKFSHKCFKCGGTQNLQLDHHLPLSKGGKLSISNCVILCIACNGKKSDQLPQEFYSTEELAKLKLLEWS